MNLYLRLLHLLVFWRFRSKLEPFDQASTPFRVWPLDLDLNLHMNNGRYLTLMDLARVDLMLRNGWVSRLRRAKMFPVVAGQTIRYRKSLALFQPFEIRTRILGWDERSFYLQHEFVSKGEVVGLGVIRGVFLQQGKGRVAPADVVAAAGANETSPEIPQWVLDWQAADQAGWETLEGAPPA